MASSPWLLGENVRVSKDQNPHPSPREILARSRLSLTKRLWSATTLSQTPSNDRVTAMGATWFSGEPMA
jgi:hypothetical protein